MEKHITKSLKLLNANSRTHADLQMHEYHTMFSHAHPYLILDTTLCMEGQ